MTGKGQDTGSPLIEAIRDGLPAGIELDEREEAILDLAARQARDVAAAEADIAERGYLVEGSRGQEVVNPSVAEVRQSRLALGSFSASSTYRSRRGMPLGTAEGRRGALGADIVTRLRRRVRSPGGRPLDLQQAFRFLGKGPSRRELGLVADQLREAGTDVVYDEELVELAVASGSSAFVALDLSTAVAYGVESLTAGPPRGEP